MSKILIVEDEEAIAELERDYLELSGYEVVIENNGKSGLDKALHDSYDLLILDLMLPRISGFEVCKMLKTDRNTWRIPIVIMSTLTDEESRIRAQEAGADHFIAKPYDLAATLEEIKKYLKI